MAWLPNGALLVTERPGLFHLVKGGWPVAAPVVGVTELFAAGQGGFSAHPGVGRRIGQVVKTEFLTLKMVQKRGYTHLSGF